MKKGKALNYLQFTTKGDLFKKSSLMALSSGLGALSRFLLVTMLARYLSPETYGIWVSITSIAAIMMFGDFGITNALRNKLSVLIASDENTDNIEREYFFTMFYFFLGLSIVLVLVFVLLIPFLPIEKLFNTSDLILKEKGVYIFIVIQILFIIGIPFGMSMGLFFSYNESHIYALLNILNSLSSLVLVFIAAFALMIDIVILAQLYFILNFLFAFLSFIVFVRRRKWFRNLSINIRISLKRVKELLGTGIMFLGIQLSTSYISNVPTIFIGAVGDLVTAASFNILQKLYTLFLNIYQSVFNPIWAKMSELRAKGNWTELRRLHYRTMVISAIVFIFYAIFLTLFSSTIIKLVAGEQYHVSKILTFLLGITFTCYIVYDSSTLIQNAYGKIKVRQVLLFFSFFLLNFFLPYFYKLYNDKGIAILLAFNWLFLFIISLYYGNFIMKRKNILS